MSNTYRFNKKVKGLTANINTMKLYPAIYRIQGTKDEKGITLSIGDESTGYQFSIPVEEILKELKQLIN